MNTKIKLLACGSSIIMAASLSNMAHAQSTEIGEIVVTARKVSESLQEIPISISALNSDILDERGLEDLTEIARNVPGFSFENYNGAFGVPIIRGQSQSSLTAPIQNVSTFYNGVYLQRGYMIDTNLLNIGQVDVLRGPQSAALGRSAYAGAVNFTSKTPGDEFTAYAAVTVGENDYRRFDVTAELPIFGDKLGLIAGYSNDEFDGGWENNHPLADEGGEFARTEGNLGGYEYETYNIGLNFAPNDSFSFKANYLNNERDLERNASYNLAGSTGINFFGNDIGANQFGVNNLNCGAPVPNGFSLLCGEIPSNPVLAANETRAEGLVVDPRTGLSTSADILSLEGSLDLSDDFNLSVTYGEASGTFEGAGTASRDPVRGFDLPGFFIGAQNFVDTSGNGNIDTDSLEARLTWSGNENLTAYVGTSRANSNDVSDNTFFLLIAQSAGPLFAPIPLGPATVSSEDRKVNSIFGFAEYKTGDFALSAEGRFTNEDVDAISSTGALSKAEFDYFTPRLTANYFYSDNNSIYLSYAKGVKAGGFNGSPSIPAEETYDTETNNTFEIGSRNKLLDGDLTLNATAYYIDAKDLQINTPVNTGFGSILANLASAETIGFEADANYNLSDALNLYGSIGYNDASYGDNVVDASFAGVPPFGRCDNVVCNTTGDISGNRLARTPRLTLNGGFGWETGLTSDVDYYIRGNASYQDKAYINTINTAYVPGRTIVDASVGLKGHGFEAKLAVDNLLDEKYSNSAFEVGFLRTYSINLGSRRRVSGTLSYRY